MRYVKIQRKNIFLKMIFRGRKRSLFNIDEMVDSSENLILKKNQLEQDFNNKNVLRFYIFLHRASVRILK